jgi:hypothetical protein
MHKGLRELTQMFSGDGFTIVKIDYGKHIKFVLERAGVKFLVVCSISPSDAKRWMKNVRRDALVSFRKAQEARQGGTVIGL